MFAIITGFVALLTALFVCCFQMSAAEKCDIKKKALNTLLGYTVLRLKARVSLYWTELKSLLQDTGRQLLG